MTSVHSSSTAVPHPQATVPPESTSIPPEYAVLILPQNRLRSLVGDTIPNLHSQDIAAPAQLHVVTPNQQQLHLQFHGSQLCGLSSCYECLVTDLIDESTGSGTLEGASIAGALSGVPSVRLARQSRPGVKIACTNCRNAGKRCDAGRPCSRCAHKCLTESCEDAPTARGKATLGGRDAGRAPGRLRLSASGSMAMSSLEVPQQSSVDTATSAGHNAPAAMSQVLSISGDGFPADGVWWSGFAGPSTSAPGIMGQPMYTDGYQGQDLTQSMQGFPHLAIPPTTGYPSMNYPTMDMQASSYPSPPDVALWSDESLAGSSVLEDLQAHPSLQFSASNPQQYGSTGW